MLTALLRLPRPAVDRRDRRPRRALTLSLSGVLGVTVAGPALGITYLDPKHAPFHIAKAQTGIATSVGSLEFRIGAEADEETEGGFRRSGQASGVVLDTGQDRTWFVTAGHNLAPLGRFDIDENTSSFPSITFGLSDTYDTSNAITINEWYVSSGFGDNAGVISLSDIAIVPLPLTPTEVANLGVETVSIYTNPNPADFISDIRGETVEIVGFGQSGNGAQGVPVDDGDPVALNFDGLRRWGQNRIEPWLDGVSRVRPNIDDNYIEMDFDVDRDDDLYDNTPNNPFDQDVVRESFYALKNVGELTLSGGVEPRQIPEEDFRVPFEVGVAPGDSGGGLFLGGALLGMPISSRAVPLNADGDDTEDGVGFGFGSDSQFITLNDFVEEIENLIFFAEQAERDFIAGTRFDPDDPGNPEFIRLTDAELASLGWVYGAPDLNPIFNFPDQDEINDRRGNAVEEEEGGDGATTSGSSGGGDGDSAGLGPEIQMSLLEVSYYAGEQLSDVSKAKLIGAVPLSASDDLTDQELIDLIDNPVLTTIEDLRSALDDDLVLFYGEPTLDRAIRASSSLNYIATNRSAPERAAAPTINRDAIGDFNGDGTFDADDIDAFIDDLAAGSVWTDLDFDGDNDDADTAVFVESLLDLVMGDANLNGLVEQGDLNAVLNNWGSETAGWAQGSFFADGTVNQNDLNAVLNNWGASGAPDFSANPGVVPEPSTFTALAALGAVVLRRRRAA